MRHFKYRSFLSRLLLVKLIFIYLLLELSPNRRVNGFVTIPAELAFGIITAAVKLKLILVKILFALKTIGVIRGDTHFGPVGLVRYKRSAATFSNSDDRDVLLDQRQHRQAEYIGHTFEEIIEAWSELESAAEQPVQFDIAFCQLGAANPYSVIYPGKRGKRSVGKSYDSSSKEFKSQEKDSSEDLMLYFDSNENSQENVSGYSSERIGQEEPSMQSQHSGSPQSTSILYSAEAEEDHNYNSNNLPDITYAQFISSLIGSMMQQMEGCELLQEGLAVRKVNQFYLGVSSQERESESAEVKSLESFENKSSQEVD